MPADTQKLIAVFVEARRLLALPGNDFSWSGWQDYDDALAEIDHALAELRAGNPPVDLSLDVLFLPTGPLQELSLSSGWGDAFLELADRYDAAMASATADSG